MIIAELRVGSINFDPKAFIEEFDIDPDAVFESSFNLCLVEATTKDQFVKEFPEVLDDCHNLFCELSKRGIEANIDIGISVGTEDQYTCSITLPIDVMRVLAGHGIQLVFSAYPACDDT